MADALGTLRRFLLLTGLYYAGAVLASLYLRTPDDVTLFWPSAGIGFALAVQLGLRLGGRRARSRCSCCTHRPAGAGRLPAVFGRQQHARRPWPRPGTRTPAPRRRPAPAQRRRPDAAARRRDARRDERGHRHRRPGPRRHGPARSTRAAPSCCGPWATCSASPRSRRPCCVLARRTAARAKRLWRDRVGRREQIAWSARVAALAGRHRQRRASGNLYALGLVSLPLALLLWAAVRFSPLTTMVGTILVVTFLSLLTGLGLGGFTRPQTLLDASVLMLLLILISVIPVMLAVADLRAAPHRRRVVPARHARSAHRPAQPQHLRGTRARTPGRRRARPAACSTSTSTTSSWSTIRPATSPATT